MEKKKVKENIKRPYEPVVREIPDDHFGIGILGLGATLWLLILIVLLGKSC